MRRGSEPDFLENDSVIVGVNLSADFTAEHEIGIAGIKRLFSIPTGDKDWGLKRRLATNVPECFGWTTGAMPNSQGFYLRDTWDNQTPDFSKSSELTRYRGTLAAAWDDKSFGVFSTDEVEISYLREIHLAFLSGDGAVFLGGGGGFGNSGLILAIASRLPEEFKQKWYDADKEAYEIEQDVKKSGIRELLAKAGKRYFALSRTHYENGKLKFWLNPMEQHANNAGWFTIDDLKAWTKGSGPIPKNAR